MRVSSAVAVGIVCSVVAGGLGYLAGSAGDGDGGGAEVAVPIGDRDDADDHGDGDDGALAVCEARLASAEEEIARGARSRVDGEPVPDRAVDLASLSEPARAALQSPEAARAIELEVERRIAERAELERARRQAEWAARRAETRERMHAIGIDEATLEQVTPAMCAIRDVYRQAWSSGRGRGGGGDGGIRSGRRELREATRGLRDEVTSALGDERAARLEEEGGLRALGGAIDCGEDGSRGAR
jgi:hypothetical protein